MDFLRSLFCKKTEPIKDISDKEQKLLENKDKNTVDVVKQNPINENEEIALLSEEVDAAKKASEEVDAVKNASEEADEAKKAKEEADAAQKAQEEARYVNLEASRQRPLPKQLIVWCRGSTQSVLPKQI
jgi:actin-related protein